MKSIKLSSSFCFVFIFTFLFLSSSLAFAGDIIYVDADATGDNNGSSWADAFADLQDALSVAAYGDEIWVAVGTYKPGTSQADSFAMKIGVAIYGGFDPSVGDTQFKNRDWETNMTILSGDIGVEGYIQDNCYHVFYHPSGTNLDDTAILDGFIITCGRDPSGGGGMYNQNSSPMLNNCTFSYNMTYSSGGGMYNDNSSPILTNCIFKENIAAMGGGGGMCNWNSSPILINCVYTNNSAEFFGGGMENSNSSSPNLINCVFSGNSAYFHGGGMYNWNSSPNITNCSFEDNHSSFEAGGICNWGGSPKILSCNFSKNRAPVGGAMLNRENSSPMLSNCLFLENRAGIGGGICNENSSPTIVNCIFSLSWAEYDGGCMYYSNSSPILVNCTLSSNTSYGTGGICCNNSSFATIVNTILWNDSPDEIYIDGSSTVDIIYSNIEGGWPGEGNIDIPPLFVDSANGDFHLLWNSQCIDVGTNTDAPSDDIEGNPRPIDGDGNGIAIVDMGAYEFCTLEQAIKGRLDNANNILNSFADSEFDKKSHKNILLQWLDQAVHHFNKDRCSQTLFFLEEMIIPRIDGCTLRGAPDTTPPHKKDWITTCEAQGKVYPLIIETTELLMNLL